MKILVIGGGGREHAICWKLKQDDAAVELFCAPGNAGTAMLGENVAIAADDLAGLVEWAKANRPDLTIVGPEAPLCAGLTDLFQEAGLRVFGPSRVAAAIEGSKQFAKDMMERAGIPTARSTLVTTEAEARAALEDYDVPVVLKADGLAAGKGAIVCLTEEEVEEAVRLLLVDKAFGNACNQVLVEEYLEGEEVTMLAFVDGANVVPMVSSQDHKRLKNGDEGPNTGGMGAYSPAPAMNDELQEVVMNRVFRPLITELALQGIDYKGVLYAGLMLTDNGPKVLEFNCRFGDPETQCVLPRMASPLLPALLACVEGTLKPELVEWHDDACVCVVMASGGYPGDFERGVRISGLEEAADMPHAAVFHGGTALQAGEIVTNGGRVLGITATGEDIASAVRRAYRAVMRVKFDQSHYRTDIAYRALERQK